MMGWQDELGLEDTFVDPTTGKHQDINAWNPTILNVIAHHTLWLRLKKSNFGF